MSTPRHPDTGQFTPAAGLPSADAVNAHLAAKPNAPDEGACAVPSGLPDHAAAMSAGAEPMDLPPGPDSSEAVGGADAGYAA